MVLSSEDFRKSYYYLGACTDIQPLLRFSALTDTFLFVDIYYRDDHAIDYITKKISLLEKYRPGMLKIKNISERFGLDEMEFAPPSNMSEIFGDSLDYINRVKRNYRGGNEFGRLITLERRIGNTVREIRLFLIFAEGISFYAGMSNNGTIAPAYFSIIQWGWDTNYLAIWKMFEKYSATPGVWVNGECWSAGSRDEIGFRSLRNRELREMYSLQVQRYGQWCAIESSCTQARSIVSAWARDGVYPKRKYFYKYVNADSGAKIYIDEGTAGTGEFADYDLVVLGNREYKRFSESNTLQISGNVKSWMEIIGRDLPKTPGKMPYEIIDALGRLGEYCRLNSVFKVFITPPGYEDEGCYFEQWIKSLDFPLDVTIKVPGALDYYDLFNKNKVHADVKWNILWDNLCS